MNRQHQLVCPSRHKVPQAFSSLHSQCCSCSFVVLLSVCHQFGNSRRGTRSASTLCLSQSCVLMVKLLFLRILSDRILFFWCFKDTPTTSYHLGPPEPLCSSSPDVLCLFVFFWLHILYTYFALAVDSFDLIVIVNDCCCCSKLSSMSGLKRLPAP